jgi:hypothetical protein
VEGFKARLRKAIKKMFHDFPGHDFWLKGGIHDKIRGKNPKDFINFS